jgi:hypothetical protein
MVASVTVVVYSDSHRVPGDQLLRSIDEQTLASTEFDIVVLGGEDDGLDEVVKAAQTEWLMYLGPDLCVPGVTLQPSALDRLTTFAVAHDCDVVIGRIDLADDTTANDLLIADHPRVSDVPATALDPAIVLYRRAFAAAHGIGVDGSAVAATLARSDKVGVAGATSAARVPGKPIRGGALRVTKSSARWADGSIAIEVIGWDAADQAGKKIVLSLRHARSGEDYWLPTDDVVKPNGAFRAAARLDPLSAALGARLADGVWVVSIGVHGERAEWSRRLPLGPTELANGITDGLLVVRDAKSPVLALDIGATRNAFVGRVPPTQVTITDTAAGPLMTIELPAIAVAGTSSAAGEVLLDDMPLPAQLIRSDAGARVECLLRGSPGTSRLLTRFGGAKASTGLDLTISAAGDMSVSRPARPAAPKAGTQPNRPAKASPPAENPSFARRLRRRIPAALNPAVERVSRNRLARRAYQKLAGLPPR